MHRNFSVENPRNEHDLNIQTSIEHGDHKHAFFNKMFRSFDHIGWYEFEYKALCE